MDFRILGRLEAREGAVDVAPRRAQARALLAMFLLHPNELVTADRLAEALWGDSPTATSDKALQGHVSALRKALGHQRLVTERGGYRLTVGAGELDADRFSAAISAARAAGTADDRAHRFDEALAMWRGEPLTELADEPFAQPEIARLAALRLAAMEQRLAAMLELGRGAEVLPELERLVGDHPLSEGLRALLMLALYRAGRQADALRVYREGRLRLAEDLGIEPGTELQSLEQQILAHDPALAQPAPVESVRPAPRQERKTVTVLMVEAVPARDTDPEDLERIAQPALAHVRSVVERAGGRAEPLFANAMLGLFGAPKAHEDDPLRAVRAALELLDTPLPGAPRLRGGIDTGSALVTVDGSDVSLTGQVLGAASRLQATAPAGSIVVGEATRRATEAAIEYRAAGDDAWAPLGIRAAAASADAPFVGRTDELALLERLFARARDERSVQLVTIMAEPGGGKSRLLREFRSSLGTASEAPAWLQGGCLSYGDGLTYWALGEIVKGHAGILESDDSRTSAAKLSAALTDLEHDETRRTWLDRSLGGLVGVEQASVSGDREQAFAAWRHFLEALAARAPLVVALEDIHWADEALLEFVDQLTTRVSGVPLVIICTARPELLEGHPRWAGGKRNATTIALEPLAEADTEALLHALLGRSPVAATVKRASGNPLFAHELARIAGAASPSELADVPESLQAVIAAHLDSLAPELKAVAFDAAVMGEVFWPGALASMAGVDEQDLDGHIVRLVANDVIRRRRPSSVARQSEYGFRHVLVRDVAYWQIPRRDRIPKHRRAGEWIERLAGDRVTNHAELIAHHYVQALDIARALGLDDDARELRPRARTFLALAGDGARTVEMAQADSFYRRALDLTDAGEPEHGELLGRLGQVAELTGRLAEAELLSEQAITELRAHGNVLAAGETMLTLAATLWRLGRPEPRRRRVAVEAIRTLEQLPAGPELVRAYARMASHELHAGRAGACGDWARKALAAAELLRTPALKVQPLNLLGIARFESGDEAGIDDIREAVQIGLEAGLTWETATAHSNLAATVWVTEGPVAALAIKRAAGEFAASRGLSGLEKQIRAESLWQQVDAGAWIDALASADEVVGWDRERGPSRISVMAQTVRARILAELGRTDEAAALEPAFLDRARELRDPQDLGPALAAGAALRLALDDPSGAAELIAELERVTRGRDPSQRVHELPHAARVCLAAGTIAVAEALVPSRGAPTYARARICLASARAIIAEAHREHAIAADLHAVAADGWRTFGNALEEAHAHLGRGRCLIALGRVEDAADSIQAAQRIGRSLGAAVLLREADRVLVSTGT